ncbi:hypothetical protein ACQP1K_26550 [Sphaerimonospora sp. CA-214678]|uniref:hypothetical protein n=1 Tax=Sphaerimonospora sp. CA-214678 TaxID=3240029 RepID=UPI003D8E14B0
MDTETHLPEIYLPETYRPEPSRPEVRTPEPELDYYVITGEAAALAASPAGIVVEEFVLADDGTATGLNSAVWTRTDGAADGAWWSSAEFTRAMRADPELRGRVVAVSRQDAEAAHRRLGAGELPGEATLRTRFHDTLPFDGSAPLRLGSPDVPEGFHDRRVYRILFAGDLSETGLANLSAGWRMRAPGDARGRVVGTAHVTVAGDLFSWDLRRVGGDMAWSVDLTACLAGPSARTDGVIRRLLRELTTAMRREGPIPVTIERFS